MKIHPAAQGSVDWSIARSGIPTASEFDNLITPEGEPRKGQMPRSYLARKLAEWWMGGPIATLNTFAMEQGSILEDHAIPFYELEYNAKVDRVGLVTNDEGTIGCSPDGLLGVDGGLELKCPQIETHVRYLLDGTIPKDYIAQVQGCLFVTGRKWWKFMSYRRRMPPLLLTIEVDLDYQDALNEALGHFLMQFYAGKQRLIELNGGPPKRFSRPEAKPKPEFISEMPS